MQSATLASMIQQGMCSMEHGEAKSLKKAFLIAIGPLIVNSILCIVLTFPAVFPILILEAQEYNWVFMFLMWVGFSIGMHAFPSNHDMETFVQQVESVKQGGLLLVAAKIFAGFLKLANALSFFWFDALYAVGISMIFPCLLVAL
jgi:hypothetical protein